MDPKSRYDRIYGLLKTVKDRGVNTLSPDEIKQLVRTLKGESQYLTPNERNAVLERFFDLWDRKN